MKKRAFGKLYKELFYIPKHEKLPDKVFRCRMVLSLLTILACTAVMAASTFALFFSEVSTDNSTIASAYYSVTVDKAENGKYICPLVFEDKHTFEIKADGTATTGYCKIQVGEQVYYTEQIPQGASLFLTVQAAKDTVITFTPHWGTSSNFVNEGTCGNEIIHSVTPSALYTVEPTAKLANIAAHYGVFEADILVYNNLSAVSVADDLSENTIQLEVGTELKIPGAAGDITPYAVPYAAYMVEPTATLDAIALHYGVSTEDILAFNGIENIAVGMSLKIPNLAAETTAYAVPYAVYTVQEGATIEAIALHYDVSVDDILIYCGITELTVGSELKIPGVSPDSVPYVAPVPEPPANTDENIDKETPDAETDSLVTDKPVSSGDAGTNEHPTEEQPTEEQPSTAPKETAPANDL